MNRLLNKLTDFSDEKSLSRNIVSGIYYSILKNEPYEKYYLAWKSVFIFLHGELDTQRKINTNEVKQNYGIEITDKDSLFLFIFALEIYYSILLKFISYKKINGGEPSKELMESIVTGDYFIKNHLLNYNSPQYYNFVFDINDIKLSLLNLLEAVHDNERIENNFDFIKVIYENLFPRELRHSMGEFYTPDWLAEFTIGKLTEDDNFLQNKLYLDPTCGSGTFLFSLLRLYPHYQKQLLKNIFGIDINPLAVLAAKTNYILFLNELPKDDFLLPFFNTDVLKNPKYKNETPTLFDFVSSDFQITIGKEVIEIPIAKYNLSDIKVLYQAIILNNLSVLSPTTQKVYCQIDKLSGQEKIEFLDRLALLALQNIDYLLGNPPWVNWEYLPKDYRKETEKTWQYYELFDYKGLSSVFIKEDISALITYVAVDNHLSNGGRLGFILKESLFKSSKQGAGFRKFYLPKTQTFLHPYSVHDLTKFSPFNGVNNKSVILFLAKDKTWNYPVNFTEWIPKGKKTFGEFESIKNILGSFDLVEKIALPVDKADKTSGWMTPNRKDENSLEKFLGTPEYTARTGVFTGGANAIFWLSIISEKSIGSVQVSNITERAKNKVETISSEIEKDFVFPFITGSDLSFWKFEYSKYILLPHTKETKMYPVNVEKLNEFPLTKKYFETFKTELENRKGFTSFDRNIHLANYYTLQRIGEYTFQPYKVAWRYIAKEFTPCVIESVDDKYLGIKNSIPNEKVIFIGLDNKDEAYYLCGLLSATEIRKVINSFVVNIQISPSTINNIKLPKFDKNNKLHQQISLSCYEGHKSGDIDKWLRQIDIAVEDLYRV